MSATVAVVICLAVFALMFIVAGVVYFVHRSKTKREEEAALPTGGDVSVFARQLQDEYSRGGKDSNEF